MINAWLVWRKFANLHDSVIGVFLVESDARQFAAECVRLNRSAGIRVESSHISTYGMCEENRRELIEAINPIIRKCEVTQ